MADLQFTVSALDKATAALLKVAAQLDKVGDKLDKLDGKVARIAVALDGDKKATAGLDEVERKLKSVDGKTAKAKVKVDVDKSLSDSLIQINMLGRALRAIALPATAIAAAPQLAAIGSAAVSASGAVAVLPAVVGAAGLAFGTLKIGLSGFDAALKAIGKGDAAAFSKAVKDMAPDARDAASAIRDLSTGAFRDLRLDVQTQLFTNLGKAIRDLGANYIPALRTEMSSVAGGFNIAAQGVAKFLNAPSVIKDLKGAFEDMRTGVNNATEAVQPLVRAFVDLVSVGSQRLPMLGKSVADLADRFAHFIDSARESRQLGQWIDTGIATIKTLGTVVTNVGSILLSVFRSATAQGASLIQTLADITGQAAAFLRSVQGQEALTAFFGAIRAAVDAVKPAVAALLPLFGDLVKVVGTNLVTVFQALGPPLQQVASALSNALRPVLPVIVAAFAQIALALVPMIAQAQALSPAFDAIARALAAAAQVAAAFFQAMAGAGVGAFRMLVPLVTVAAEGLTVLLHVIEPIAPALGVVVAAFLAFRAASAGIGAVQGVITGVSGKIAEAALNAGVFTEKISGSAAAGQNLALAGGRLTTVLGAVSTALPIIAVAAGVAALAYDGMRNKSDELAASVINGQMTMAAAVQEQTGRIETQKQAMEGLSGVGVVSGMTMVDFSGKTNQAAEAAKTAAQAFDEVTAAAEAQIATLPPLAGAQQLVRFEEERYASAVQLFGQNSPQAIAAQDALTSARQRARDMTQLTADAEKTLGDRISETQQKAAAAANADIAYQQGLISLADASNRAADAARNHAAGSDEVTRANLAVQQASLSAADAAGRKAQADAEARGASDAAAIGAQAYKDELQRQADTLNGPARQAALDNIALLGGQTGASDTARTAANLYKGELQSLADKENGPLRDAILGTIANFDNLGGAHASAEQRSQAQRDALQRLADQAQGPTKQAILDMIRTIDQIHDKSFTVTGTGHVNLDNTLAIGESRNKLNWATGGVLPGYTPGRDVHTFRSATGGTLHLSGGESVMRPEFTTAVGAGFVNGANAAARARGVSGVRSYLSSGSYANGGVLGEQRFAGGGDNIVLNGVQPFRQIPTDVDATTSSYITHKMAPALWGVIQDLAAKYAAAVARAAAAAAASVAGGVSIALGGGGARNWIIAHESGGNPTAQNPTSTASGLYQMINGTWKAYGGSTPTAKQASVAEQNAVADRYVAARYGSWENAQRFWISHHYYDRGGILPPGITMAVNNTGGPERVLSPAETRGYRGGDGALIAELRAQNQTLRALRGDVDQGGHFAELIGQVRALRAELASTGRSVTGEAGGARYQAALGAF